MKKNILYILIILLNISQLNAVKAQSLPIFSTKFRINQFFNN